MSYTYSIENFHDIWQEFEPLFRAHYSEMLERLAKQDIEFSPFNWRLDEYLKASHAGYLIMYVARLDGKPVGHCAVYITNDMHNMDLIAQEDALYITKEHRKGIGKNLVRFGLIDLRDRGVKRLNVSAMTDLRVAKLWERMGFKHTCANMTYTF
jgi:GNAT superfamily N-acetyltransferase